MLLLEKQIPVVVYLINELFTFLCKMYFYAAMCKKIYKRNIKKNDITKSNCFKFKIKVLKKIYVFLHDITI